MALGKCRLQNTSKWVRKERFGLPEYLLRTCPSSLREGRRLKTKFRLGCHDLRSSRCRMQRVHNAQCPCCESRKSETIQLRFLNERGQASIMNQLVAQFSRTSIEGTPPVVPPLPAPGPSAPRPGFPPYLPRSLIPIHLGVPMVPGLPQQTLGAMPGQPCVPFGAVPPGSQPVTFAAAPPAPAFPPCSGDESLGKGV